MIAGWLARWRRTCPSTSTGSRAMSKTYRAMDYIMCHWRRCFRVKGLHRELGQMTNMHASLRTVRRALDRLCDLGELVKFGTHRGGYLYVKTPPREEEDDG